MTQRYSVAVVCPNTPWMTRNEVHRADSWQSAVLSHSDVGAEFEDLVDEFDLETRCEKYGYSIEWSELP